MISTVTLPLLLLTAAAIKSCIVKQSKSIQNHWDYLEIPRNTNKNCECGRFNSGNWTNPSWNLYVHVQSEGHERTCIGTIIASNLVVTSHKCLVLPPGVGRMRLYDILKLKMNGPRNIASVDQVTVTNTKAAKPNTVTLKVVDIFYNPQYALSSELKKFPENDLVLIKVEENLLTAGFTPICVPFHDKHRIGNISGFYYGYTINKESDIPTRHFGVILEKRGCYERLKMKDSSDMKDASFDKTLCMKFLPDDKNVEGGPLIYGSEPSTAFLMGVASIISSATGYEASTGQENVYFSSIKPLVKFVEYYADLSKSVWCRTPKLTLKKLATEVIRNLMNKENDWPWDMLQEPIERDDSLDCVCGLQRSHGQGRIVGGSETPPREYGWMAVLIVGGSLCGGSIINDRVILTAAHCVRDGSKTLKPEEIGVTINAHWRQRDPDGIKMPVEAVLFHPDYRSNLYFDYDIALLILKEGIKFPQRGSGEKGPCPVCLPEPGVYTPVIGKLAKVVGWGLLDPEGGSGSNTLQHLDVPIQPLDMCRSIANSKITDNFLCAGTLNRYKDSAAGDSGGPLMIQDMRTDQWYQVGLVSFGDDVEHHPSKTAALYSDVQKLLPFVDFHSRRVGAKWCKSK